MQIQKINNMASFGMVPTPIQVAQAVTPPPAIINECASRLVLGKNAIKFLHDAGITLKKGLKSIDIYEGEKLIGNMPRPTNPLSVESFVKLTREIRKEFAEFTDSRIKIVSKNGTKIIGEPIITLKLKGPGRTNVDKTVVKNH